MIDMKATIASFCSYKKIFLALLLLVFCLVSCRDNNETKHASLSPEAKKAIGHADSLGRKGKGAQSMVYLDSVFATLKKPSTKDLFEKYRNKADYYLFTKDIDKAKTYIDSILYVLKGKDRLYKFEYASALFAEGDLELAKGAYNLAFEDYYEAYQYALKNLDQCKYYEFSFRLGLVRAQQERYQEAIPFFKQAILQSKNCDIKELHIARQGYINSLGFYFEKTNHLDSAIYYYQEALATIGQEQQQHLYTAAFATAARGVVYGNLGGTYLKLNKLDTAERYLKQSIAINDKPGFEEVDAQTAKLKLASLYLKQNRLDATNKLLQQLQQALNPKKPEREMPFAGKLMLHQLQSEYFEKTKNRHQAYRYLQQYYALKDSAENANKGLKQQDIEATFKQHAQEDKLALMDKDNEIKHNYIAAFFVFSIMVIGALLLVWLNHRKLKVLNSEIITQNMVMQKVHGALQQSQEENTRMMKIVAHDLRSPIAANISIGELLKMAKLSAADQEMLALLETTNQQSLDMIGNLLNMNAKADELVLLPVNMRLFLKQHINFFKFKANEKKQRLKLNTPNVEVQLDEGKIWRVLSNLIANAIKFSPPKSTILINLLEKPESVVVSVSDEGIGIPNEIKDAIFNIFTEARRQGTSGEHSFGLGLAISKQIIEAHHGRIWLESEVGKGSTFFVELPKKQQ